MNRMLRCSALLVVLALGSVACAQTGLRVRLGYGWSSDFDLRTGGSGHVEGPELALSIPFTEISGTYFYFEPSFFGGGRTKHGSDQDTDVYRFTVVGQRGFGVSGLYLKGGVGVAHNSTRTSTVNGGTGIIGQVGAGFPVTGFLKKFNPTIEVNYFIADRGELRGIFVGLTGGF